MEDIKWKVEILRIGITVVSVIVAIVFFGASLQTDIALNQQAINQNTSLNEKIMTNHLPHLQDSLDRVEESVARIEGALSK